MGSSTTGTVRVPGANLYYQLRGSGPMLLMIAGGSGGANGFDSVASYLETTYTILTYDRRGYSRSPLDEEGETTPIEIRTLGDDTHRLLAALTCEPVWVFGSSLGALIGLDLVMNHPEQVRLLVAHEPPLSQLLADKDRPSQRLLSRSDETPEDTIARFAASLGISRDGIRQAARKQAGNDETWNERKNSNAKFFLEREAPAVGRYRIDFNELKAATAKLLFVGGTAGREYFPYQSAKRAAEIVGKPLVEFPGHHAGFAEHPEEFALRLREVLEAPAAKITSPTA